MDYPRNQKNICNICLESNNIPLLPISDKNNNILQKITKCFHIHLYFDKSVPFTICSKCISELDLAYNFRVKCKTYNESLNLSRNVNNDMTINESDEIKIQETEMNYSLNSYEDLCSESNEETTEETKHECIKIIECILCSKVVRNSEMSLVKRNLSIHTNQKHGGKVTGTGSSRRYHCSNCSYNTPHSQTLVNHMRRHNADRPYQCECGKCFTQYSSLAAHRKTHSTTTFYTCAVCGKQFKHAFTLKKHHLVHEEGKYVCNICNKQLKSRQSLQDHIHRHNNVRNYSCEDCGATFVTSSELFNHRKKHSVNKKIECHLCGYKTHTKKNLIVHLKRHSGDKKHTCNKCLITFYTNGDLQRHKRVHTKEKPYGCPTCTQRFTHSPSLNKHMLTVHGVVYRWADSKWKELKKDKL